MASRGRGTSGSYPPSNAPRQNEYFVPRDGIDREVITADICRYLGNDALVRPGTHPAENGRLIQGYFITAYRNLTSAMIADLKNDSARWEAERRKNQSGAVRYQDSQIRDGPQRGIGSGAGGGGNTPYGMSSQSYNSSGGGGPVPSRDYDPGLRYPGSEAPGYSAAGPGGPGHFGPPGGLGGYGGGPQYPPGMPPQTQFGGPPQSGAQDPRYGGPAMPMGGMNGNYGAGGNAGPLNVPIGQEGYSSGALYAVASNRDMYAMDMQMTDAPPRRNSPPGGQAPFGNPGNNARGAYNSGPGGPPGGYGGYANPPASNLVASYAQPIDNGYGRAPTSTNPAFSPAHELPPPPQQAQHGQQPGPRRDRDRAVSERADLRDRDRIDRPADRDRDATPPNRTGSATKAGSNPHHHPYGRR